MIVTIPASENNFVHKSYNVLNSLLNLMQLEEWCSAHNIS
jgi:hypothetical protein